MTVFFSTPGTATLQRFQQFKLHFHIRLNKYHIYTILMSCFNIFTPTTITTKQILCFLTYLLHGAKSSLEANRSSAGQEIPSILRNPEVHYHVHNSLPPVPEPDWFSPCHHPTSRSSILTLSSHLHLGLPSGLLPSVFPTKTPYQPLLSSIRATCTAHLSKFLSNIIKKL